MTILIIGGSGYTGSHTALELLKENHNIVVLIICVTAPSSH